MGEMVCNFFSSVLRGIEDSFFTWEMGSVGKVGCNFNFFSSVLQKLVDSYFSCGFVVWRVWKNINIW